MKLHQLLVFVALANTASRIAFAQEASEAELRAASVPVLATGSSRQLAPTGRAVITANGRPLNFDGVTLFQIDGKLMVPLRTLGEALGANVSFNPTSGTVFASRAGYRLQMQGGIMMGGHILVPLRTLSESLGVQVAVASVADLRKIALSTSDSSTEPAGTLTTTQVPSQQTPFSSRGNYLDTNADSNADDTVAATIQYNLTQLNALRANAGVAPLKLDKRLCDFALQGSRELMRTHVPHGHFKGADIWKSGFENAAAENQGDPHGWFPGPINQSIDQILKAMMDEGPGGGHHDNILNPAYHRVGIGLLKDSGGRLYFTNDFSG